MLLLTATHTVPCTMHGSWQHAKQAHLAGTPLLFPYSWRGRRWLPILLLLLCANRKQQSLGVLTIVFWIAEWMTSLVIMSDSDIWLVIMSFCRALHEVFA